MSRECISRTSRRCTTTKYLLGIFLLVTFPAVLSTAIAKPHQLPVVADADDDTNWPPFPTTATVDDDDGDTAGINNDSANLTVISELCWTSDECSVAAEFNRIEMHFVYPYHIDCAERPAHRTSAVGPHTAPLHGSVSQISLNGCGVNRSDTLGVEFVPDPQAVRRLQVRMFRVSAPIRGGTFGAYAGLNELVLADNILGGLQADSLHELLELRTLVVSNNNITAIDDGALVSLTKLDKLTLREPHLALATGPLLPASLRVWRLQAHNFTWLDVSKWPSLEQLSIHHTPVSYSSDEHFVSTLQQSLNRVHTLELVACNLTAWPTFLHTALRTLNISHNRVQHLNVFRLPQLLRLDLSANWLLELPDNMLRPAAGLRYLNVQHNRLERLANNAFGGCTQLQTVWLAGNRLRQIAPNLSKQQRPFIHIDANPWSCRWVQDISNTHPQMFVRFQYTKRLDVVSVDGLPCRFYDSGAESTLLPADAAVSNRTEQSNRRHPKDTAMLTLIILVVGVTFLFLLLFLHIRCRRAAMQPFYRTLPYEQQQQLQQQQQPPQEHPQNSSRRPLNGSQQSQQTQQTQPLRLAERVDFVRRELPATDCEDPMRCRAGADGGGRDRMRLPQNSCGEAAADGEPATRAVSAEAVGVHVGEVEINESKRQSVTPRREPTPGAMDATTVAVHSKQRYASMNNMLFDKSGNDERH